jgi:hypothetical protein
MHGLIAWVLETGSLSGSDSKLYPMTGNSDSGSEIRDMAFPIAKNETPKKIYLLV